MNYIKEVNGFREWKFGNKLSPGEVSLWHTLLMINNMARWKKAFNAPNLTVQQLSGLSRAGVHLARLELVEQGLIKYYPGKKGEAPIYEMVSLEAQSYQSEDALVDSSIDSSVDLSVDSFVDLSVNPSVSQQWNILKHKQKKKKEEEEEGECALIQTYEKNIGTLNPLTKEAFNKWMHQVGEDVMLEAIKLAATHQAHSFRYVEKILMEWQDAELVTLTDVTTYEKKKTKHKQHSAIRFKQPPKLSLFDELRQEVSG